MHSDNSDLICPRCRYDLSGIKTERCPECGLELTVETLARYRIQPPLSMPAMLGMFISGSLLMFTGVGFLVGIVYFLVMGHFLVEPRHFARLPHTVRVIIVAIAWLPIAFFLVVLLLIIFG